MSPDAAAEFGLEAALHAHSSTPDDEQLRCPHCGNVVIHHKSPTRTDQPREYPEDWRCNECGAHFDEPAPAARGPGL